MSKDSNKNKVIQIPADDTLYKNIKKLAEMDERSVATYCKRVLQNHVEDVLGINSRKLQLEDLKKVYLETLIQNSKQENIETLVSTDETKNNDLKSNTTEVNKENTKNNNTQVKKKKKIAPMKSGI